ncbi:MAG: hypothetical protein MR531_06200 [Lachnospiraceae bacterium]|nr:hypothetical protein [Lachnospiraceae bacterium]
MKRTNLVNKSVKLLMSVIIASSVVAMGSNGTVAATLTNNDAIISSIVMAAETTPLPKQWSTAEVYKDARYGETWSGEMAGGSYVSWKWLNDQSYVFSTEGVTTNNGTNLNFQWLIPVDMTQSGSHDTYYSHTDNNEPIRKWFRVSKDKYSEGDHLWNHLVDYLQLIQSWDYIIEAGNTYLQTNEDENFCRYTLNVTQRNDAYGTIQKGYCTIIEVKATGEEYTFWYEEQEEYVDLNRALTVIYSCLPVIQK